MGGLRGLGALIGVQDVQLLVPVFVHVARRDADGLPGAVLEEVRGDLCVTAAVPPRHPAECNARRGSNK